MRIWIILALVGLLCGCQQPGSNGGPKSASEDDGKLRYFEPEFSALLDQVVVKLERVCAASVEDADHLNDCLREQFASAFDDSRQGRKHCDFHPGVADYIGCVAIGNTFIDIRHRLSDDSPVPAKFWREEGAMVDALVDTIVKRGIDACDGSADGGKVKTCVMSWFERQVALPSSLVERCDHEATDKDRYGCVVEAVMLRYLQDHVPRLGAIST